MAQATLHVFDRRSTRTPIWNWRAGPLRCVVIRHERWLCPALAHHVAPTRLVGAGILWEILFLRDLPGAVLAGVFVLVDATGPGRLAPVRASHEDRVPAAPRGIAVRVQRDHRRKKKSGVQPAFSQS